MTTDPGSVAPPDDPAVAVAQASELLDRMRIAQARAVLSTALLRYPGHQGLLYEAARADYLADDVYRARATLTHLLALNPRDFDARFLLACVEFESGDLTQAEDLLLALLREAPQAPVLYATYARVTLRALQFDKASRLVAEGLRNDPHNEECLRARVLCDIIDGRSGEGSQALAQLVASDPDDLSTLRLVVTALVHANRFREALRLARDLLRAQPDDEGLLALVRGLQATAHWSMWPLARLERFGVYGQVGLWVVVMIALRLLSRLAPSFVLPLAAAWIVFVAYSWLWPPLFSRWLRRHQ